MSEPGDYAWLPKRPTEGRRRTGVLSSADRAQMFTHLARSLSTLPWNDLPLDADSAHPRLDPVPASFVAQLGTDALSVESPKTPARSGGAVYMLRGAEGGALLGVLKVFRDRFELLEELAANGCLSQVPFQHATTYRMLALFRTRRSGHKPGFAALMEPARGVEGMRWLEQIPRDDTPEIRAQAKEVMAAMGRALAELHHRLPRSPKASRLLQEQQALIMMANFETAMSGMVLRGWPLDDDTIDQLRLMLELRAAAFVETQFVGVTAHHDLHPGNLFVVEGTPLQVTVIDTGSMVGSLGHEYAEPGSDYAYLHANILTLGEMAGVAPADIKAMQEAMLASYLEHAPQDEDDVGTSLDFHTARLLTQILASIGRALDATGKAALDHEQRRVLRMLLDHVRLPVPPELGLPAPTDSIVR